MTDKELLEKAAKASGLFNHKYCEAWKAMAAYDSVEDSYYGESWSPLTDDGDALRLAADVGLMVDFYHERVISGSRYAQGHRDWLYADDCDGRSMLLAITRAAAAMVKE